MSHAEDLLKLIALEMAHTRLGREAGRPGNSGNTAQANLARVITAKAYAVGLAAPTMLRAELEYRYRSASGEHFVPSPEQALRIDSALWADDFFINRCARASLLADKARVTVRIDPNGTYQGCAVDLEQTGLGWVEL